MIPLYKDLARAMGWHMEVRGYHVTLSKPGHRTILVHRGVKDDCFVEALIQAAESRHVSTVVDL